MHEFDGDNINEGFQVIIENYEVLVKDLKQELTHLKAEQNDLKLQLKSVLNENQELSKQLSLNSAQNVQQNDIENDSLIANLKQQISILLSEKDCISKLWQEGVKTIDHLEDELKVYRSGYDSFVPKKDFLKAKNLYEDKIDELQLKLQNAQKKLDEALKQNQHTIQNKRSDIDQSLENQASALKIVRNLESEVLHLQKRLQEYSEEKRHLEKVLFHKDDVINGLKKANTDCLNRVVEAVGIVEAALNEKDAALFREQGLKEENEKLVQEMTEIVKESQEKITSETNKTKAELNERQRAILEELSQAHNEIKIKTSELQAAKDKSALLEKEIERMHKGHCSIDENEINKLLVLEKNLESTFQKLLLSEKQNIQLSSEKELLRNDLEQMAQIYERNLKAKEVEMSTLKAKIHNLEGELSDSYSQINKITERMTKLNEQISRTEKEFQEEKEKLRRGIQSTYEDRLEQLTNKNNENIKELQAQMEKKNEIDQKWRDQSKIITDNLEKLVMNLKQETHALKKDNKNLKDCVKKAEDKVKQYRTFLELISKDVAKISHLTLGTVS